MYEYTISISLQVGVFDTYGTRGTEPSLCKMVVIKHKSNVKRNPLRYRSIKKAANGGDILKNLVSLLLSSVYLTIVAIYKITRCITSNITIYLCNPRIQRDRTYTKGENQ